MILTLKRNESNEFIQDILNDTVLDNEYESDYKMNWQNQIKKMINNDTYVGISLDTFKQFYNNTDKKTLISTIISKLYKAINISLIDDDTWDKYINTVENIKPFIKNNEVLIKEISTSYKHNKEIREKYKGKIILKENNIIDLTLVFDDIIVELAEQYQKSNNLKSESKKKTVIISENFKRPEKYNLTIGQEFESISSLSEYTNTSRQSVSKWLNKQWIY